MKKLLKFLGGLLLLILLSGGLLYLFTNESLPTGEQGSEADELAQRMTTSLQKEAFDNIISFLAFLDSIQTNNLPNIADYITLPEVVYFLARQTWDEALHSRSYGHILQNMMSKEDADRITYRWRENPILRDRIQHITDIYETSREENNLEKAVPKPRDGL